MKKQVSTLSLIALAAFSIWQYFTEHKKDTKSAPTTTQQQTQSAVKNTNDFGNYDVIMRDDAIGQNKNAPVDYYMLALSWSPAFCEKQRAQYGNNLPEAYFKQEKALFESLSLPNEQLSRKELFQWMKQNNPQLKGVYLGASHNELFICYDRQWQVIDCPK
ncbi:MAG: hypothetical protein KH247_07970 [Haemophilus parainfluenzae]|nr:hypothetical protein [Haemophilus parainfluenzae]